MIEFKRSLPDLISARRQFNRSLMRRLAGLYDVVDGLHVVPRSTGERSGSLGELFCGQSDSREQVKRASS